MDLSNKNTNLQKIKPNKEEDVSLFGDSTESNMSFQG